MTAGQIKISKTATKITAPTGKVIWCLEFKEDTVITEITAAPGYTITDEESSTKKFAAASNAITHYSGTRAYGRWIDITLTSGYVIAYLTK